MALHAKWFDAFDSHDGSTMEQLETGNLMLVMPDGTIFAKKKPRAGVLSKSSVMRALSDVSVRQFGDTAILTGVLTTAVEKEGEREASTVVFVRSSGRWKIASAQWSSIAKTK